MIHTDIQRGFVRAEIVGWEELVSAGGYAGARDRGTLRLEGRDYVVDDGDVITVKFTPLAARLTTGQTATRSSPGAHRDGFSAEAAAGARQRPPPNPWAGGPRQPTGAALRSP